MSERTLADSIEDLAAAVIKCKRDRDDLLTACEAVAGSLRHHGIAEVPDEVLAMVDWAIARAKGET